MMAGLASATCTGERDELARLRGEHGNIARLLLVLESHLATIHAGESYDARLLLDALTYLFEYVDRFHREREDLFVAALAVPQPMVRSSLASLAVQHFTARASGGEVVARLERVIGGGLAPHAELVRHGFAYCTALRRAMALEEDILGFATTAEETSTPPLDSRGAKPSSASVLRPADEDRYLALFEALTHRVGCDCFYVRSS